MRCRASSAGAEAVASSARTAAARGCGVRPPATGGATRRASSDAVGSVARRWARRAGEGSSARRQAGPPVRLGRKRGGGPVREKWNFSILFLRKFQIAVFKYPFEQENDFFLKWTKNKSCLEFNPLQLCFRDQLKILHRF